MKGMRMLKWNTGLLIVTAGVIGMLVACSSPVSDGSAGVDLAPVFGESSSARFIIPASTTPAEAFYYLLSPALTGFDKPGKNLTNGSRYTGSVLGQTITVTVKAVSKGTFEFDAASEDGTFVAKVTYDPSTRSFSYNQKFLINDANNALGTRDGNDNPVNLQIFAEFRVDEATIGTDGSFVAPASFYGYVYSPASPTPGPSDHYLYQGSDVAELYHGSDGTGFAYYNFREKDVSSLPGSTLPTMANVSAYEAEFSNFSTWSAYTNRDPIIAFRNSDGTFPALYRPGPIQPGDTIPFTFSDFQTALQSMSSDWRAVSTITEVVP